MDPERDLDAAERALGTEPRAAESAEERRAREAWELRLAPILDVFEPADPPAGLFARVEREIDHQNTVIDLATARGRVRRWQGLAALAGAAAAALAIWVAVPGVQPAPRYVAVVTADEGAGIPDANRIGMVIEFDTGSGIATVIPLGGTAPDGRSAEMWHLPDGAAQPYSLGLLPEGPRARRRIEAGPGDIFAISFEEPGGSPSGQPTDARFHGRIERVE